MRRNHPTTLPHHIALLIFAFCLEAVSHQVAQAGHEPIKHLHQPWVYNHFTFAS